jgi:hypothetical protein
MRKCAKCLAIYEEAMTLQLLIQNFLIFEEFFFISVECVPVFDLPTSKHDKDIRAIDCIFYPRRYSDKFSHFDG